jgi:hypothetical protein
VVEVRESPPELDILRVWEYLGGELPPHVKTHGWTPVRCIVHGGGSGSINASANKFHCFGGCDFGPGKNGGDGYDLLRVIEGIELAQAKELAESQGWVVDAAPVGRVLARKPTRTRHADRARPERHLPRKDR